MELLRRVRDKIFNVIGGAAQNIGNVARDSFNSQPQVRAFNTTRQALPQIQNTIQQIIEPPQIPTQNLFETYKSLPVIPSMGFNSPTVGQVGGFARDTGQSWMRDFAGLGQTALNRINPNIPQELDTNTLSPAAQILFGKNQTIRTPEASRDYLKEEYGLDNTLATGLGFAAPALTLADPFGAKNLVKQGAKQALKKGGKEVLEEGGEGVLKAGLTPRDPIAKAKADIQEALKLREKAPDVIDNPLSPVKDKAWYDNYIKDTQKYIDSRVGQAGLYDKGKQEIFYRGEGGTDVAQGQALLAKGRHFAMDSEYPKRFGEVKEYVAKPGAKVFDAGEMTYPELGKKLGIKDSFGGNDPQHITPEKLTQALKEKGYDVIKYTGTYQSTGKPFTHVVELTDNSLIPHVAQNNDIIKATGNGAEGVQRSRAGTRVQANGASPVASLNPHVAEQPQGLGDVGEQVVKNLPRNAPKRTEELFEAGNKGGKTPIPDDAVFDTGNKVTRKIRDTFLDTPANLKKTFGDLYDTNIAPIIKEHGKRLGQGVDWKNLYRNRLTELPVKIGSDDDKLIREIGKKDGFAKVASRVGQERAAQLQDAYTQLRSMYDEILDTVNARRKQAGLNLIPKKKDFLSQVSSEGKSIFDATLQGTTESAGPTSQAIFKKQGKEATTGAIESMRDYLEYAARAGFSDLTAQDVSRFRQTLSASKSKAPREALEQLLKVEENILGSGGLPGNFEKVASKVLGKMRSAAVVGKVGTLINQGLSLPQGIAASGPINFAKSVFSSDANQALAKSNFIKAVGDKIPRSLRTGNAYTKAVGLGGDALVSAQQATNKALWKAFYKKGQQMGLGADEALDFADSELPKIVGDRRLGMSPEIYNSFIGKIFGAFTLEPTAASTRIFTQAVKGFKGNPKALGEVIGTVVAWHYANKLNEKYGTGYEPFPDPVDAVTDAMEYSEGSDTKEKSNLKAIGRIFSEMLQTTPVVNSMFNTAYAGLESKKIVPDSREVFGQDDNTWMNVASLYDPFGNFDRKITGNPWVDKPVNVAANFLPFVEQGARSTQSLFTQNRGHAITNEGDPMYEAPSDPIDTVRSVLMGQGSTQNARDWFDNDYAGWLSDKQKTAFDALPDKESKMAYLKDAQTVNETRNKAKSDQPSTEAGNVSGAQAGKPLMWNDKEGDVITVSPSTATDPYQKKEEDIKTALKVWEGNASQEEKKAFYKSVGLKPDDVRYAHKTSWSKERKVDYIIKNYKDKDHDTLIEQLIKGRTEAISGYRFISNEVLNDLYDEGVISKDEMTYLKKVEFNKDGKLSGSSADQLGSGSGSGKGGQTEAKIRAKIKSLNALFKESSKPEKAISVKTPKAPELKFSKIAKSSVKRRSKSSKIWFDA